MKSGFARRQAPCPAIIAKSDDAALSIRQYVAALTPTFSGFFLDQWKAKLASATVVASN
ncbi:MAG: hypothetical protein WBM87_00195 [Woeseiaceae bacterium]|jgi:hypothetical protein